MIAKGYVGLGKIKKGDISPSKTGWPDMEICNKLGEWGDASMNIGVGDSGDALMANTEWPPFVLSNTDWPPF